MNRRSIAFCLVIAVGVFLGTVLHSSDASVTGHDSLSPSNAKVGVRFPVASASTECQADVTDSYSCEYGDCDNAVLRNAFIPGTGAPIITIRAVVHVPCEDDGSGCLSTKALVDAQMAHANLALATAGIQVVHTLQQHRDSRFTSPSASIVLMKHELASDPEHQLNIFVYAGGAAEGEYPWFAHARTDDGGVYIRVSSVNDLLDQAMAHEIGHVFGLLHTHFGATAFDDCENIDPCYEFADGSNGDVAGDLCSDTPPAPADYGCCAQPHDTGNACVKQNPPAQTDCAGTPWGDIDFTNVMGYSQRPAECRDHFTAQQAGRARCWINRRLVCWVVRAQGDMNCSGAANMTDIIRLRNYVLSGGPVPCPLPMMGDLDGSCDVTLADVIVLANYIFKAIPLPDVCTPGDVTMCPNYE